MTDDDKSKLGSLDIKRARELCAAATRGPWHHSGNELWAGVTTKPNGRGLTVAVCEDHHESKPEKYIRADAAFIAAARELLPMALDRVEELERWQEEFTGMLGLCSTQRDALRAEVGSMKSLLDVFSKELHESDTKLARAVEALRGLQPHFGCGSWERRTIDFALRDIEVTGSDPGREGAE